MDKERLEEIKEKYLVGIHILSCTYAVGDDSSREWYSYILADEDYHWLMEQVERSIKYHELLSDIANLAYYKEQDAEYYESLLKQVILFARNTLEGKENE